MAKYIENLRIKALHALTLPALLRQSLPSNDSIAKTITTARQAASAIIHHQDDRLILVVGPCSIHDPIAAMEYATRLQKVKNKYINDLHIIMRVYFEKPRTTIGWKGLINDPHLDSSFRINEGLHIARKLLLDINSLGIPTGSEFLDTIIPQYISDCISWSAIGARTTESQIHRELASGLSMPVGFKNSTTGNVQIAIDAVKAANKPHHFLGVSEQGIASILSTDGNQDTHIILRGSNHNTNHDPESITGTVSRLRKAQLPLSIMVDCSHGNSRKDYKRQTLVVNSLCQQLTAGNNHIVGAMIESNLLAGQQKLESGKSLEYGKSITDGCISWDETVLVFEQFANAIRTRRQQNLTITPYESNNKK